MGFMSVDFERGHLAEAVFIRLHCQVTFPFCTELLGRKSPLATQGVGSYAEEKGVWHTAETERWL
jgi:hypothetical protein